MGINFIDIIISLLQSILFVYISNYCLDKYRLINIKIVIGIILLAFVGFFVPYFLGNFSVSIFITHILAMLIIAFLFKDTASNALVAFGLIYSIISISTFVFGNLLYGVFDVNSLLIDYIGIDNTMLLYILQFILIILYSIFKNKIKQLYKLLCHENIAISYGIILGFIPDFLNSLYFISYDLSNELLRYIVKLALFVFFGFCIVSSYKIIKRAEEISKLNNALTFNNEKLKKIKNDYKMQMVYLYELSSVESYGDITSALKSVINNKDKPDTSERNESLLVLATKHVRSENVNVIVEDKADFELMAIPEIELYRIIINIVNNAIRAMKNKGTLIVKSSEDSESIIVTVENDGEKIPEEIIDIIFDSGFTTKNNADESHGYGLSIAKELIEKHSGKIAVCSNDEKTIFTVILPRKSIINNLGSHWFLTSH